MTKPYEVTSATILTDGAPSVAGQISYHVNTHAAHGELVQILSHPAPGRGSAAFELVCVWRTT